MISPSEKIKDWRYYSNQALMAKIQELGYSAAQLSYQKSTRKKKPKHTRHPDEVDMFADFFAGQAGID